MSWWIGERPVRGWLSRVRVVLESGCEGVVRLMVGFTYLQWMVVQFLDDICWTLERIL